MPGWMKAKNPGQPAVEPVKTGTKKNWIGQETSIVIDAEGDEVYGGTWGATTPSSPFPTGTVPEGSTHDLLKEIRADVKAILQQIP